MEPSTSRSIFMAVLISALLHLVLLYWLTWIYVGKLVIPAERLRTFRPFEIHQAEIPPQALSPEVEQAPDKVEVVPQPEPPGNMPEPGKVADPALQANPPHPLLPDLPVGNMPTLASKIVAPPLNTSPYAPEAQANITAEISKLIVEPDLSAIPVEGGELPSVNSTNVNQGLPVSGLDGSGTTGLGTTAPTLEQIESQFRLSAPAVDPNIPAPVIVRLPSDILFDFDSSQLRQGADATLQLAVDYIKKFNLADIQVDGHTDTIGEAGYNLKLSTARAVTVMKWLQQRIADPAYTWHTKGWGKSRPIVNPQGTVEAQEKNRRVEIVIRATKGS